MKTLYKMKEPAARATGLLLLAVQAAMGMPFLLTIVGSLRHWGAWFYPRNPR
ncbi:MAG: hypothetical protein WAL32_03325 [Terriglobales bacterium]